MSPLEETVDATLDADGQLRLAQRLHLAPGPVRVTVRAAAPAETPGGGGSGRADHLVRELASFASLPPGWDGYAAAAPSAVAIRNGQALVTAAAGSLSPGRVEPSAMGGVGVTFASGEREVIVEFYNNGTAHALFSDDATGEMRTRPVRTGPEEWPAIIGEAREFLHAR